MAGWADYDNDGFFDLFVGDQRGSNKLYRNNGNSNSWLEVQCAGTASNRSGIGTKVRVNAFYRGANRRQLREITGGDGLGNSQPLLAHFGLGDATNIDTVRIEWPSGIVQEFQNVAAKQFLTVTEPPQLRSAAISNGIFQLTSQGGRGFQYALQASSNLVNWETVAMLSVTNISGAAPFADPAATNFTRRFYRAVGQ